MQVAIPMWGLCPFRSPVVPEVPKEESVIKIEPRPREQPQPAQALGPCLSAACALWKVTEVRDGKPVSGMCSFRYTAEVLEQATGALQAMAMKYAGQGRPTPATEKPS